MSNFSQHELMPSFGSTEGLPPEERVLNPDEQVQVDLTIPLADSRELYDKLGLWGSLVATVNAGSKSFMIADTRGEYSNRDFIIADETFSTPRGVGFKGVQEGAPVVIGRNHHAHRFDYPDTVSRDHFVVLYENGELFICNLRPTNKTTVTAHMAVGQKPGHQARRHIIEAERTSQAEDRVQDHPNFGDKDDTAPYGYYLNHPILGRASMSVEGGVYMGGSAREAIVVDGKSLAMRQVYKGVDAELRQSFEKGETLPLHTILVKVMNHVQAVMPYDSPKTEDIGRRYHGDALVGLSTYLKEGAGVCRHQALMAAYILENLIRDGHMLGTIGVERNTVKDLGGTHAWAVYKTKNNGRDELVVVDPAQSFVGTKAQAEREGRWEYRLGADEY